MGIGTEALIGHEHVPGLSARMHGLHPGELVGEEGRDDPRQAHPGARMNSPSNRATGTPHPGRGSVGWPNASGGSGDSGMAHPEPSTRHVRWPGHRPSSTAARGTALPKRSRRRSEAQREVGPRVTVGRRAQP